MIYENEYPATPAASLTERTYQALERRILTRGLPGGVTLVEGRLAEEMAVSRTPMREALSRLAGAGLLTRQANGTYMVRRVGAQEFFQCLKVRLLLEPEAAALTAQDPPSERIEPLRRRIAQLSADERQAEPHWSADDALHQLISEGARNPVMAQVIERMRQRTRLFEMPRPFDRVADDAREHEAILDALERRDADGARAAVVFHLKSLETFVLTHLVGG